eukprot:9072146-Karenia_brevis.AAC.1
MLRPVTFGMAGCCTSTSGSLAFSPLTWTACAHKPTEMAWIRPSTFMRSTSATREPRCPAPTCLRLCWKQAAW